METLPATIDFKRLLRFSGHTDHSPRKNHQITGKLTPGVVRRHTSGHKAFTQLKNKITEIPCLAHYSSSLPIQELQTPARKV